MKNFIFIVIVLLIFNDLSFGQCSGNPPLSFTFESTESRCESNGIITVHITGGTPFTDTNGNPIYNNTIIAPIVIPIGGQADSVFSALEANTYTIQVADANGCTVTQQVVVPGTHMQLELTPTWGPATCDGSGGGWICGTPAEGRPWPPGYYKYQLFDGSTNPPTPITSIGLDSCFTDLAVGDYEIRAFDSCNNFQTRDVVIPIKNYSSTFLYQGGWKFQSCDTGCYRMAAYTSPVNGSWGEYPYQWEVIQADTNVNELIGLSGLFDFGSEYDTICHTPLFPDSDFVLQVTDACGNTTTRNISLKSYSITASDGYDCIDGGSLRVPSFSLNGYCTAGSVTYELTSGPTGFPLPPAQNTDEWTGLPDGYYCVKVTDCCGNVDTHCEAVNSPNWIIAFDTNTQESCVLNWVGFDMRYSLNGGSSPSGVRSIVTSAPVGYPLPLPDTLASYSSDIMGPPGNYCVTMYDDCGRRDSACAVITDVLSYQTNIEVIPGCVTGNQVNITSSGNVDIRYDFTQITPVNLTVATRSLQTTWTNLDPGTYVVDWENFDGYCYFKSDTIVIPMYIPPSITGAWGIECSNGAGLISVEGAGGRTPYTYELFQGPATRPLQSSPEFPGLPVGTYDIRLNDACNNSSIVTVSIEPFAPVIQGYGGSFCLGDTAFLFVDYFELATYSWSGPNGASSDSAFIMIPNVTLADAGTYTIDIDVKNPDQSACIAQTLSIQVDVFDCTCGPGDFTVQNIDCFEADNGTVSATMISNSGGPFTYDWNTGDNTQTINNLPPGTYMVTITDAGGCVITADTTLVGPPKLNVTASIDNVSCTSTSDGQVTVDATGGVPNYNYQWSAGQMDATLTGLFPGTYSVSVTDANGCCSAFSLMVGAADCAPCELAENNVLDICIELTLNPNSELATLDCDNGGIDNQTECDLLGAPLDPADDCQVAADANIDICALISGNPDHPLADQDCDDGGVSNAVECANNGDPLNPIDDCTVAFNGSLDICVLIGAVSSHPLAALDCDGGGVDNYTECTQGGDPSDAGDDCEVAIVAELDICTIINSDPNHPWASLDCDNGGIINSIECDGGMNPADPLDDLPCAPCDVAVYNGVDICEMIGLEQNHPLATLDCDNGGIDNQTECNNGGDPNDPADECDMAIVANANICALILLNPTIGLSSLDCDNGGVTNIDECLANGDPNDTNDDCSSAINGNLNICQLINYDPNHPLAVLDCDAGGIDNWTECQNGGDPSEPSDDCQVVVNEQIDLCTFLTNNPNNPLSDSDCDGDGVTNGTECIDMTDPLDPCLFDDGSITLPVTADQSDCENLCPDLTPTTTILPGNIAGVGNVGVAVEITELNGIDTDGTGIFVRMPSDPRLAFIWDPVLTSAALVPVNNSNWNYLGDNGVVHTFQYNGGGTVITGATTEAFGFQSIYDPQNTDGQTTITASIVPFGGGECNILNDTDSERLVYFQ